MDRVAAVRVLGPVSWGHGAFPRGEVDAAVPFRGQASVNDVVMIDGRRSRVIGVQPISRIDRHTEPGEVAVRLTVEAVE